MTVTISSLVSSTAANLEDSGFARWTQTELVEYCNRAIEDVCRLKPDAYTVRSTIQLTSGPIQTLPTGGHRLIRATRNMGENGAVPGDAIRHVNLDAKTDFDLAWYADANATQVDDVMYDEANPLEFYVSPPALVYIEIIYAAIPTSVTISDNLPLLDIYRTPILYFMQAFALQSNRSDADFARANAYLGLAFSSLGLQMQNEKLLRLPDRSS